MVAVFFLILQVFGVDEKVSDGVVDELVLCGDGEAFNHKAHLIFSQEREGYAGTIPFVP